MEDLKWRPCTRASVSNFQFPIPHLRERYAKWEHEHSAAHQAFLKEQAEKERIQKEDDEHNKLIDLIDRINLNAPIQDQNYPSECIRHWIETREMCLYCNTRPHNIGFIPCGHLLYCEECTSLRHVVPGTESQRVPAYKICPCCREPVEKILKIISNK